METVSRRLIVQKPYARGEPFVTVRVVVTNPDTGRQTSFDQPCWTDTGFSGGVHVPQFRQSEINAIGVEARLTTVKLAGGVRSKGHVCLAYVQRIEDHDLPSPGIETELLIHGEEPGYLGLEVLRSWVAEFDGLQQMLSVYESAPFVR